MQAMTFVFAFVAVLALIGVVAWLVRRFAGDRLGGNTKSGRMPRLAVIDAAAVDGRRRLVLVRRDNVEHLLMIGGPSDIVVEPNIVRAQPARAGADTQRLPSLPESIGWSDGASPRTEPAETPEPAAPEPRPSRPAFVEDRRPPMPPLPERRMPEPAVFPPLIPDPMNRPEPRQETRAEPIRPPRSEPMMPRPARTEPLRAPLGRAPERPGVTPPPPPASPAASATADQNLAEMAQRLEAALRRPGGESNEPRVGAPPVAPEPPPVRPAREAPSVSPAPVVNPPIKTGFENLEDEMASLLGRPKNLS